MHCDILQPPELPLSPPAALPSILHLPIDLDARSLPLTHSPPERPSHLDDDQSLLETSPSAQDADTFFHRPSPLPTQNWLDVGSTPLTERDPFEWEDGIKPPQPLCHEPLRSVWSPESPPPIEELDEMDFDPSTPSSSRSSTVSSLWSLESLPDEPESDPSPRWTDVDGNWTTSPDHQHDSLLRFTPVPPSFSYPGYDYNAPPNHHWDDRGYLSPTGFSPDGGEELLRSPSSPRSPLVNISDLPLHYDDDDDDYDTSALLSTPNRRKSLPELEDDYGHMSPSSSILNLPGPGTDDVVMDFDQELPEIDLTSPPLATCYTPPELFDGPALGLYVADEFSNATQSPSPEYTHVDDFFTYFPELEKYDLPNTDETAEGLDPSHPDYDLVRLIRLCRRSREAEKTARAREIKIGEKVKAITASMCPPDGVDTIEKRIALQQEYTRKMEQAKIRKRERERCRELRSLLRIKLESMEREKGTLPSQDQISGQEDDPPHIQEETMGVEEATKATIVEGPNKKWMSNDMGQLVAKMLFSRRDVYKPLGTRKMPCHKCSTYTRSSLAYPRDDTVVDPDAVLVGDVDVIPMDVEGPPISN